MEWEINRVAFIMCTFLSGSNSQSGKCKIFRRDPIAFSEFRRIAGDQEKRASESVSRSSFSTLRNRQPGMASSWVSSAARPQVRSTERR